jgi:hypothetical protein
MPADIVRDAWNFVPVTLETPRPSSPIGYNELYSSILCPGRLNSLRISA